MLGGVDFDGVSQDSEVIFCGGLFCFRGVSLHFGDDECGNDAEDADYYEQFYERKGLFHW